MNREKIEHLLSKHHHTLTLVAQQYTTLVEDAEDLLQDTLLLLWERSEQYIDINFAGYCYTLLRNLYLNNSRHINIIEGVEDLTRYEYYDEEYLSDYKDILQSIEQLPQCNATAMKLYIEGYRYEEIATQLHINIGTVKSRISRARTQLKAELNDYYTHKPLSQKHKTRQNVI